MFLFSWLGLFSPWVARKLRLWATILMFLDTILTSRGTATARHYLSAMPTQLAPSVALSAVPTTRVPWFEFHGVGGRARHTILR